MEKEIEQASANFQVFSKGETSLKIEDHKSKIQKLNEDFTYVFKKCPWVLGKIPVITITFIEHVLKVISKLTMEIVLSEIKNIDEEFFN